MNKIFSKIRNYYQISATAIKNFIQKLKADYKKSPWYLKILKIFLAVLVFISIYFIAVDVNFLWMFGKSPNIRDIKNPNLDYRSEIFSSDGKLIATFYAEDRTPAEFKDIPQNLINSLVATEDVRFYKHSGIDLKGTAGAVWNTMHGDRRGGSTITQQLVKNLFKTRKDYSKGLLGRIPVLSILVSKTKEWISAVKIEMLYSKDDILLMYLNTVDFGHNTFGINSAAAKFFSKKPNQLTYNESALLVGMLKAPSYYSPISKPERALKRRNQVLAQLKKYGYISAADENLLKQLPLNLNRRDVEPEGNKSYLRDAISRELKDWAATTNTDLWRDGVKIYTSIDSRMQQYAEEAVKEKMKSLQSRFEHASNQSVSRPWIDENGKENDLYFYDLTAKTPLYKRLQKRYGNNLDSIKAALNRPHKMSVFTFEGKKDSMMSSLDSIKYHHKFFQTGFLAMEPESGYIRAWVGGINYEFFKFDHVEQSRRQPGSLFKAYDYVAAMDNGYGPCDTFTDKPVSIEYEENGEKKVWEPRNVDRSHSGTITLKRAFARSVNSIAVQLAQIVGINKVIAYAKLLGITSPMKEVPSVSLGTSDVTLKEIVNSYCTFVNGGNLVKPILVTRIEDADGKIIYQAQPTQKKVLSDETAFLMQVLLQGGLTEPGGTTQGLWDYDLFDSGTDFGGKTGTTQDYTDGWFIGVTPGLVAGCWTGNDNMAIHFNTSHLGEGLRTAQPVYGVFMEKVLKDDRLKKYRQRFKKTTFEVSKKYECYSSNGGGSGNQNDSTYTVVPDSIKTESISEE